MNAGIEGMDAGPIGPEELSSLIGAEPTIRSRKQQKPLTPPSAVAEAPEPEPPGLQGLPQNLKKVLPSQSRLLVARRGPDGRVYAIGRYKPEDVMPDGDVEGFIMSQLVPKYGGGEYPLFIIDRSGKKLHWQTVSFPVQPSVSSGGSMDAAAVVDRLEQARESGAQVEREKFRVIQETTDGIRSQFNSELAELKRQVLDNNKDPADALVKLKMIQYMQEQGKGADDGVVRVLGDQLKQLQEMVLTPKKEDGNGRDGTSDLVKMMLMKEFMSDTRDRIREARPPMDGPIEIGPARSESENFRDMMTGFSEMMKSVVGLLPQPQVQAQPSAQEIVSSVFDKVQTMMGQRDLDMERRFMMMESKLDKMAIVPAASQGSELDRTLTTITKLREAAPVLLGDSQPHPMELAKDILAEIPATVDSIGKAWERRELARAQAAAMQGATGSTPSGKPAGGKQKPAGKTDQKKPGSQSAAEEAGVTENDQSVLHKFARSLAAAQNDNDVWDAIAYFIMKMHAHEQYGPYIRAISMTGGSDRKAYIDQIINVFYAGKAPPAMSQKVCDVIQVHQVEIRDWLRENATGPKKRESAGTQATPEEIVAAYEGGGEVSDGSDF